MSDSQEMSKEEATNLAVLYKENAEVTKTFWEWRNKLMTRFFTACAGILAALGWMFEHRPIKPKLYALLLSVGSVFPVMTWILDGVNVRTLRNCYKIGREIEERLSPVKGIYKCIDENYGNLQYHKILSIMYLVCAFVLAAMVVFPEFIK